MIEKEEKGYPPPEWGAMEIGRRAYQGKPTMQRMSSLDSKMQLFITTAYYI